MDSEEDEYEKERIRRIKAALEKYRVKEPVYQIKPIIKNTNKHKNIDKIKHSENKNKDKPKDNNDNKDKNFLNKKRERVDKEKP